MRLAQCAGRPENEASEPYLSDIGVPLKGFLLKNVYHFLQQKGLGGLYPSCEDCLSFAVVAAEFWSLQKKCGSQRTNRVRQTLGPHTRSHRATQGHITATAGAVSPRLWYFQDVNIKLANSVSRRG